MVPNRHVVGIGHDNSRTGWDNGSPRGQKGYVLWYNRTPKNYKLKVFLTFLSPWSQSLFTLSPFVQSRSFRQGFFLSSKIKGVSTNTPCKSKNYSFVFL